MVGGAPRSGKSTLAQQFGAKRKIGWVSTDLLFEVLKAKEVEGTQIVWDATPQAITANADWFYPCLERFVFGASSLSEGYVIEGVSFLPDHVAQLSERYDVRPVFLGCSSMTLEQLDRFPGQSKGYAGLSLPLRRQIAADVPRWSEYIRQEAERFGHAYIDTSDDFSARLREAEAVLLSAPAVEKRDKGSSDASRGNP